MRILHINFHSSQKYPITLIKTVSKETKVKVDTFSPVKVKSFSYSLHEDYDQEEHGEVLDTDKFYTFETNTDPKNMKICLTFYSHLECFGISNISNLLKDDYGSCVSEITSVHSEERIGDIMFEYLFLPVNAIYDARSFGNVKYQPDIHAFAYVGHRGLGYTKYRSSQFLENTIDSFLEAYRKGARFIEIDVQLTKDLVPLVYHDDITAVINTEDKEDIFQVKRIPVKDIQSEEIRTSKMDFARPDVGIRYDEEKYKKLFPALNEIFSQLPEDLGILMEVKYPEPDQGVEGELLSKTVVVDRILEELTTCKIKQPLIFCGFDLDICLMLKHKQDSFPVIFCTCGEDAFTTYNPWEPYDIRTRTRMMAANLIIGSKLDGISICGDPLAGKNEEYGKLVNYLKSQGKLIFSWGSANNSAQYVSIQKSLGVNGTISDNLAAIVK